MKISNFIIITFILGLLTACQHYSFKANGISVAELLNKPVYDQNVELYGQVSQLNDMFCPCFKLTSRDKNITVWYDKMQIEGRNAQKPAVDISNIKNGDQVLIVGQLKKGGWYTFENDFWLETLKNITLK